MSAVLCCSNPSAKTWWGLDTTFTNVWCSRNPEDLGHWRKCFDSQDMPSHQSLVGNIVLLIYSVMLSCCHIRCGSPPATQLYLYVTHAHTAPFLKVSSHHWVLHPTSFQTWPSHLPGPTFPYNVSVPAPESRSLASSQLFLSEGGKKNTPYLMTVKVHFCFLSPLRQWPH